MTYLLPDDWYANHGLAPGDAVLPQKDMQPGPGNQAPTPPFRGYFGPRPPPPDLQQGPGGTVSPFAVSDSMWGVNGLGALVPVRIVHRPGYEARRVGTKVAADLIAAGLLSGLGAGRMPPLASRKMRAQLAGCCVGPPLLLGGPLGDGTADANATILAAQKKMKAEIMEVAASNLAIGIGLACIPVVGWAVGLVYSIVTTITEQKYQQAAQKVMAGLQVDLTKFAGNLDIQLQAVQSKVFDANKDAGIQLAVSGQPIPNLDASCASTAPPAAPPAVHGLGDVFSSINKQVERATVAVGIAAKNAGNAVTTVAKAITGQDILNRARAAASKAYAQATAQMQAQYNTAVANVQSPAYAQSLIALIACRIRQDPSIAQMVTERTALESAADSDTGAAAAGVQSTTSAVVPGVMAAGAVLLVGFIGNK